MRVIASWSGGKDSCLACHRARGEGHQVVSLLNFISRKYRRCCFHGVTGELMRLQAGLAGIPIVQKEVTADMKEYEREFKEAVSGLKAGQGVEGMVFGDVCLDEHREWLERVCGELGVRALEPLWGRPPAGAAREFVRAGFEAVVVSCKADILGKESVGRAFDEEFIRELERRGICPCGENGEFHTFVTGGPLFRGRIGVTRAEPVLKQGFWEHWFLDIQEWEVRDQ